jgi:hypothetical protein
MKALIATILINLCIIKVYSQKPLVTWSLNLGGTDYDTIESIVRLNDGSIVGTGATNSRNIDAIGNRGGTDLFIFRLSSSGQILWKKVLGGSGTDKSDSVIQSSDGNIIVSGDSNSTDGDVGAPPVTGPRWIIKMDINGNIIWKKLHQLMFFFDICASPSGGFYAAGYYDNNCRLLEFDSQGNFVRNDIIGPQDLVIRSIKQSSDGGFILGGYLRITCPNSPCTSKFAVLKLNQNRGIQWQQNLGGVYLESAFSVTQTPDGYFLAGGFDYHIETDGVRDSDCWLVKFDFNGNIIWDKKYGGLYSEELIEVEAINQNEYVFFGYTGSVNSRDVSENNGFYDFWLVKVNASGNIIWEKNYGGYGYDWVFYRNNLLEVINDKEFIIAGVTDSNSLDIKNNYGSGDIWVTNVKICDNERITNTDFYNTDKIEVHNLIQSTNKIQPNASVIFDSGKKIELLNGFEAKQGSIFSAIIDGCGKK